ESASSGVLTAAGTWSGTANQANTLYRVGNGHTVNVNGATAFAGKGIVVGKSATGLTGDYSGNGSVGPEDFTVWKAAFNTSVSPGTGADGNSNGVVDAADYTIWRDSLGATGTTSTL